MQEQSNAINDPIYTRCSLCRGSGMVSQTDGLRIKCPACFSKNYRDETTLIIYLPKVEAKEKEEIKKKEVAKKGTSNARKKR